MNYVFLFCVLVLASAVCWGYRTGVVKGFQTFLGWLVLGGAFILLEMTYQFYKAENKTDALITFLIFIILCLGYKVVCALLLPAKLLSKLPVIQSVDKFLGIAFGVIETLIIIWIADAVLMNYGFGIIGEKLTYYMQENEILNWLYQNNYLIRLEQIWEQNLATYL